MKSQLQNNGKKIPIFQVRKHCYSYQSSSYNLISSFVTFNNTVTLILQEKNPKEDQAYNASKLLHIDSDGNILWEREVSHQECLDSDSYALLSQKLILMLDVERKQLKLYHLQKKQVQLFDYEFLFDLEQNSQIDVSRKLVTFPESKLICLIQWMKYELQLTYFQEKNIQTIFKRFKYNSILEILDLKPINLSSKICWYSVNTSKKAQDHDLFQGDYNYKFYFYDIEKGFKGMSLAPLFDIERMKAWIIRWKSDPFKIQFKAELHQDQYVVSIQNCAEDQFGTALHIKETLLFSPFSKELIKELNFHNKDNENLQQLRLDRFNVWQPQNIIVVQYYDSNKSQALLLFMDVNQRKVYFEVELQPRQWLQYIPENNILILQQSSQTKNKDQIISQQLKIIRIMYPKYIFLQMLLFLNQDFDDDILYDAIYVLDMI